MFATIPYTYPYQPSVSFSEEARFVDIEYLNSLKHLSSAVTTETLEAKFKRLSIAWKNDIAVSINSSSYNQLLTTSAYVEIIAMGKQALPFIFKEMKNEPDHWFIALNLITSVNPVKKEHAGNIEAMTQDWISWAQTKGLYAA